VSNSPPENNIIEQMTFAPHQFGKIVLVLLKHVHIEPIKFPQGYPKILMIPAVYTTVF
jgi:hypothetical protein